MSKSIQPLCVSPAIEMLDGGTPKQQLDRFTATIYDELRAIAARSLEAERNGHTLSTTVLVHEAYLRLAQMDEMQWRDRGHILAASAGVMRRILVDYARSKRAGKRSSKGQRLHVANVLEKIDAGEPVIDLLALEDALQNLAAFDERAAQVVELRFFGGMTLAEIAAHLEASESTIRRDWTAARAWLLRRLQSW